MLPVKKRLLAAILSVCMAVAVLPAAALTALADGVEPAGDAAVNQTTSVRYPTLAEAIGAAQDGETIQLLRDETVSGAGKGKNGAAILITSDIVLDGGSHTITAVGFELDGSDNPQTHIISVENGAEVTMKDLSIEGNASTKHGINVWAADQGSGVILTLENVAIRNCGTAGMVINNSQVTASGLTTSGNVWGAVNVDNNGQFTLTGTENNMDESVKLWTEKSQGEGAVTIDVSQSNLKPVKGEGATLKGYTYYTDDVSQLGEGYNETTQTVYEDLDAALSAVSDGHRLRVVRSAALDSAATLPAGVTLTVDEGVTLATNDQLTSEGEIVNHGSITGQVTASEPSDADQYRVTYLADDQLWYTTVLTQSGNVLSFTQPADPTKAGHTFAGWDYGDNVSVSDGTVTLTVDAAKTYTFHAQWTATSVPPVTYPVAVTPSENGQVTTDLSSAAQGQNVTITVTPQEGFAVSAVVVAGQDGSTVTVTDHQDGTYTFTMPAFSVTVAVTFSQVEEELPFLDVSGDNWYFESVRYIRDRGLMQGVGDGLFAPNAFATRAMLMTVLARLDGEDTSGGSPWYEKGLAWAVDNGVSDGTNPGGNITREQVVTMLYRYAGEPAVSQDHLSAFPDSDEVSGWAREAMNWAVSIGLIQGRGTSLAPTQQAPRAELAALLHRFCVSTGK